jgi:hypothetical protein
MYADTCTVGYAGRDLFESMLIYGLLWACYEPSFLHKKEKEKEEVGPEPGSS